MLSNPAGLLAIAVFAIQPPRLPMVIAIAAMPNFNRKCFYAVIAIKYRHK
jgi:hypothetical protein